MKNYFIRFPSTGRICSYQSDLNLKNDQEILAEADGIIEQAVIITKPVGEISIEEGRGKILKPISAEDKIHLNELKDKARSFIREAREKAFRHGLDMNILDADLSYDEKKLTFYFCSDSRVDFRSLVSDMVQTFSKLIRLQQVGARDEAKFFGGIGKCGRELCCSRFLNNLESITLEMAQVQELATAGSAKLSGCCGKLMCCLAFEASNYEELKKKMPKIGSNFSSNGAIGRVIGQNILEGKVVLETKEGKKIEVFI